MFKRIDNDDDRGFFDRREPGSKASLPPDVTGTVDLPATGGAPAGKKNGGSAVTLIGVLGALYFLMR